MKITFANITRIIIAAIFCFVAIMYATGPISALTMQVSTAMVCGGLALNAFSGHFNKAVQNILVVISCLFAAVAVVFTVMFMTRGYLGMNATITAVINYGCWGIALICAILGVVLDKKKKSA